MSIERIRYMGSTYFLDPLKPSFYVYDKDNVCHIIMYTIKDYAGVEYIAKWCIPGTRDKDITYAERMALKLYPRSLYRRQL